MEAVGFAVLFGMLCCILFNLLLVKQMLQNHHDQTAGHRHGEIDQRDDDVASGE